MIKTTVSNREIWRRYVWPRWGVSERTFYNMLNASAVIDIEAVEREKQLWIPFPD